MFNLSAFLSYVAITTFTPGPNNILSLANAGKYGFQGSLRFLLGIFAGFFLVIILCSLVSFGLYQFLPAIKPLMTVIGTLYILWLAWKTLKSPAAAPDISAGQNSFQTGFLLQFVNPKVILYGLTTVSTFIIPYYNSPLILIFFAGFMSTVGFISTCCWAMFGAVFQEFLARHWKSANIILSLLLVYCAVSLFF